jgi:hypothetical protein
VTRRTVLAAVASLVAAGCLTSCVRIPTNGPVNAVPNDQGQADPIQGPYSDPRPPQPNANPGQIVTGFLDAMTAIPIQTAAAQEFLTREDKASWNPQRGVIVYDEKSLPRGTSVVSVRLRQAHLVGPRGNWRGLLPASQDRLAFPMQVEGTQWRIAAAPDALVVPRSVFQQQYQSVNLYFFDPTGRILVPEPVYLPGGGENQRATSLVRALLMGPRAGLAGVARTFIPPGLSSGISVLVSSKGVANVTLRSPGTTVPNASTTQLMLDQLSWTLGQESGIRAFQLTIGGHPITDADGSSTFRTDSPSAIDPAVPLASAVIFALKHGKVVSGPASKPSPVQGPFGSSRFGIDGFAVNLDGTRLAGTTATSLLVGGIQGGGGGVQTVLSGGSGLLLPAWDFTGRLWEISSGPSGGARVQYLQGSRLRTVPVPGVTGEPVKRFLVSRDASRMVAVIRGRKADRIVVSRLRYDAAGGVLGATRAIRVPWQGGGGTRIRDIGWTSPTSIAVLHLLTQGESEVRTVDVDGSTPVDESVPTTIPGSVHRLATSPVDIDTSFAVLPQNLYDISQTSSAVSYSGLHHITYAG